MKVPSWRDVRYAIAGEERANLVRSLRNKKRLTCAEIARALDVATTTPRTWEHRGTLPRDPATERKWYILLGVDVEDFPHTEAEQTSELNPTEDILATLWDVVASTASHVSIQDILAYITMCKKQRFSSSPELFTAFMTSRTQK
jgi:transcriptional regulator with XRE-family HTH domain